MVVDTPTGVRKLVKAKDFWFNSHRILKRAIWIGKEEEYFTLPPTPILGGRPKRLAAHL